MSDKTTRLNGWLTLTIAVVLPIIFAGNSGLSVFAVGEVTGYVAIIVGLAAYVIFSLFSKSNEEIKINISLAIGIIGLLYSFIYSANAIN